MHPNMFVWCKQHIMFFFGVVVLLGGDGELCCDWNSRKVVGSGGGNRE